MPPPPDKKKDSSMRDMAVAFSMATNFVVTFVIMAGIGYAVDRWVRGGGYLFTMIGVGVGLVAAVTRIIIDTQRMEAAECRRREGGGGAGAGAGGRDGPKRPPPPMPRPPRKEPK